MIVISNDAVYFLFKALYIIFFKAYDNGVKSIAEAQMFGTHAALDQIFKYFLMQFFHVKNSSIKDFILQLFIAIHHPFGKNCISSRRIIDKHVGNRTAELSVLKNRTAAHALHDAACFR